MHSERGYVWTRALIGLGLVTVLVWMAPVLFMSRRHAQLVAAPAPTGFPGGSSAPAEVAVPVGATGQATAPAAGAAPTGATGQSTTADTGTTPTNPIGQAKDLQAQSMLNNAIRVAQLWYAESGTFAAFGPEQAAEYEPSITFTAGAPALDVVAMRVTPDAVVVVTLAESGPICAAFAHDVASFGRVDALTADQCQGGW